MPPKRSRRRKAPTPTPTPEPEPDPVPDYESEWASETEDESSVGTQTAVDHVDLPQQLDTHSLEDADIMKALYVSTFLSRTLFTQRKKRIRLWGSLFKPPTTPRIAPDPERERKKAGG
ncbi:hypothetical protein NMY22_g3011 [Coprinellus aureogranulatus]|nr:hypothetical protein NMY22_g3011 [Coprinellus aureogranulatus]